MKGSKGVWNSEWRAYTCQGINYRLMIIESMDRDTKIRRLSPIAMLADAGPNGYIDLVNGKVFLFSLVTTGGLPVVSSRWTPLKSN